MNGPVLREGVRYRSSLRPGLDAFWDLFTGIDVLQAVWLLALLAGAGIAVLLGVSLLTVAVAGMAAVVALAGGWLATSFRRGLIVRPDGVIVRGRFRDRRLAWSAIGRFEVVDDAAAAVLRDGSSVRIAGLRDHSGEGFREWWLIAALNDRLSSMQRAGFPSAGERTGG